MNIHKVIPIQLNQVTAYLAGAIIGDGHISNSTKSKQDLSRDYRIRIEIIDYEYLQEIEKLVKSVITTKSSIKKRPTRRGNRKDLFYFEFRNKSFYHFLTNHLKIPCGKKSSNVFIPQRVIDLKYLHWPFLAGLFDTDGGIRSTTLGFCSASPKLTKDVSKILAGLNIKHSNEVWLNKKHMRCYYGVKLHRKSIDRFLNRLPMQNKRKRSICFQHVDVPEWSNGQDNSLTIVKD